MAENKSPTAAAPRARILVIASLAESLTNFRSPMLARFRREGHEVICCAPDFSESVDKELKALGIRFETIPMQRTGTNPVKDLHTLISLYRLTRRLKPDAVLSYTIKPVLHGSLAAHMARVPKVFSMITGLGYSFPGDNRGNRLLSRLVEGLYRLSVRRNTGLFFQNPDDQANEKPSTRVVIKIGAVCSNLAASILELKDEAFLLGERIDMHAIMASLDILCVASYGEGFSNAIGEEMACAVPCVVTYVGDSAWIVGQTGIVAPARNHQALAMALTRMPDENQYNRHRLGWSARQRIINKFSLDQCKRKYELLYTSLT